MKKEVIKCDNCGFKYYDGDVHKCPAVSVQKETEAVSVEEEKPKENKKNKETARNNKQLFKIWGNS